MDNLRSKIKLKKNVVLQIILLIETSIVILLNIFLKGYDGIITIILIQCLLLQLIILMNILRKNKDLEFLIRESRPKKPESLPWKKEDESQLRLIRERLELNALQSQINPHFLYNTLDSIRSKALLDGQEEVASMTEILSKFFRYCISNNEQLVKIREEMNHIMDYYYIQKYRFDERLEMEVVLEEESIYDLYIPKMTLQPIIENAMIHGLEKMPHKGIITIHLYKAGQRVVITIIDNGAGMSLEQLAKLNDRMSKPYVVASSEKSRHNGMALTNVNARIKLIFGEEYGIHYRSIEYGGTDAVINFPVIDEFERMKYNDVL